ncbi:MAG: low temperature requirement protein A [Micromonosporaceae bacterium]
MTARSQAEPGRAATPLELLFDLTFVVAVALLARELAHAVAADHAGAALPSYLMVFFAIWWAWMNFTWFASAYDTDDVIYRLLTMSQMGGVLVLAAGVPAAFEHQDFTVITYGYVIMRVSMVLQWLRAASGDPDRRGVALRYAAGTGAVQIGWLLRLLLPAPWGLVGFGVLVAAELVVPYWAELRRGTTWHPHHIAERYGLFTIIVLGECVLAATTAIQATFSHAGVGFDLVLVGLGALLVLFTLWWLYFLQPARPLLERRREQAFWWGYGHYGLFAALAALGAGLEVSAESLEHHIAAAPTLVATAVAAPIMVVLLLTWALHAPLADWRPNHGVAVLLATAATGAVVGLVQLGLPLPWAVLVMSLPPAGLLVAAVRRQHAQAGPRPEPG